VDILKANTGLAMLRLGPRHVRESESLAASQGIAQGKIEIDLHGQKLKGKFALIRIGWGKKPRKLASC